MRPCIVLDEDPDKRGAFLVVQAVTQPHNAKPNANYHIPLHGFVSMTSVTIHADKTLPYTGKGAGKESLAKFIMRPEDLERLKADIASAQNRTCPFLTWYFTK